MHRGRVELCRPVGDPLMAPAPVLGGLQRPHRLGEEGRVGRARRHRVDGAGEHRRAGLGDRARGDGADSPVTGERSSSVAPARTRTSAGTRSPEATRSRSPGAISASGPWSSPPSGRRQRLDQRARIRVGARQGDAHPPRGRVEAGGHDALASPERARRPRCARRSGWRAPTARPSPGRPPARPCDRSPARLRRPQAASGEGPASIQPADAASLTRPSVRSGPRVAGRRDWRARSPGAPDPPACASVPRDGTSCATAT